MNELKTLTNDFTVTESGDAYISQTAISRITGIPLSTLNRWILEDNGKLYTTNKINQLDAKSLQKLVIMGSSKYTSCFEFMGTLLEAGAKAYIYHEAGYKLKAEKQLTTLEMLSKGFAEMARIEQKQSEHDQKFIELESKIESATLQHSRGCPEGLVNSSHAYRLYGTKVSRSYFDLITTKYEVSLTDYIGKTDDGMEVMMKAVDPAKVENAVNYVFSTLEKVTKCYYESSLIPGKRVKFNGEIK